LFLNGDINTKGLEEKLLEKFLHSISDWCKILRAQGINFKIYVKSRPCKSNKNYFFKTIIFEGLKKDKNELETLRDLLKRYFDHDYKRTFILFPPKESINKKHINRYYYDDSNSSDSNSY
jgi:hypothetical protein